MKQFNRMIDSFGMGLIFLLLCLFFCFQSDTFLTQSNFSNIFIQTSVNIIIATGMTFVISAAEIDLSVGSLLAFCGMITAFLLKIDPSTGTNLPMEAANAVTAVLPGFPYKSIVWWTAAGGVFLTLALLPGVIAGGLVGSIVVLFGVPSFIVTLGFMMIHRGLARYLTNAAPITGLPPQFMTLDTGTVIDFSRYEWASQLTDIRITYSVVIALAIAIIGMIILARTRFGRHVLSVGGNPQASYLSGVSVGKTRFKVFVASGLCVSIAAILQTSRLFIGDPNAGEGYELDAIAAVIIGGTSLFGGKGTVLGTLFGALIIGVLRNGLDLMGVTDHLKQIVIGSMIIFAVLLDYYRRRFSRSA
ncbi:MAG: ABC transporter permease [Candidatus Omnitrophica bacterium]|nr:ABC transporter permease [Candidatus Omnitrophota bacterium]